jgi:hypothetical protein
VFGAGIHYSDVTFTPEAYMSTSPKPASVKSTPSEKKSAAPDVKTAAQLKPGPEHQQLATRAGVWDVACSFWMKPDDPVTESKGAATFKSIFDGKYIQGEFTATMMGKAFVGHSIDGYNAVTKQYQSVWYDTNGTSITSLSGPSSNNGKTVSYSGETTCAINGHVQLRHVETHQSNDQYSVLAYQIKDGKERKVMEFHYTRRH